MAGRKTTRALAHPALYLASIVLVLLLPACGAAPATPPAPVFLKAAGSTSMEPLLAELGAAYSARQPHIVVDIEGGDSLLGQQQTAAGRVDMGLVSWPPLAGSGGLRVVPIARDAVAVIVHPQHKSVALSLTELRDILSGRLLNWQEVGGPAGSIQVISREEGSGTRAAFESLVMDGQAVTPTAIVLPNSRAVVDYVAGHPEAMGYESLALADDRVAVLPIDGVVPGSDSLASGSYPLARDLAVILASGGAPEVEKFIEFVLSPAGQAIVSTRWGRVR